MKQENSCAALSEMDLQTLDAANYGNGLLADLGCQEGLSSLSDHTALSWRRSGLLQTTKLMLPILLASHCLLYTSPSPRDGLLSRMPSSA